MYPFQWQFWSILSIRRPNMVIVESENVLPQFLKSYSIVCPSFSRMMTSYIPSFPTLYQQTNTNALMVCQCALAFIGKTFLHASQFAIGQNLLAEVVSLRHCTIHYSCFLVIQYFSSLFAQFVLSTNTLIQSHFFPTFTWSSVYNINVVIYVHQINNDNDNDRSIIIILLMKQSQEQPADIFGRTLRTSSTFLNTSNFNQTLRRSQQGNLRHSTAQNGLSSTSEDLLQSFKYKLRDLKNQSKEQIQFKTNLNVYLLLQKSGIDIYQLQNVYQLRYLLSQLLLSMSNRHNYISLPKLISNKSVRKDPLFSRSTKAKKQKHKDYRTFSTNSNLIPTLQQNHNFGTSAIKDTQIYIDLDYQQLQSTLRCMECDKWIIYYNNIIETLQDSLLQKEDSLRGLQSANIQLQGEMVKLTKQQSLISKKYEETVSQLESKQQKWLLLSNKVGLLERLTLDLSEKFESANDDSEQERLKSRQSLRSRNSFIEQKCVVYERQLNESVNTQDELLRRCLFTQALSLQRFLS